MRTDERIAKRGAEIARKLDRVVADVVGSEKLQTEDLVSVLVGLEAVTKKVRLYAEKLGVGPDVVRAAASFEWHPSEELFNVREH